MNMKADFSLMEKFVAIVLYPKHKKSIHPKKTNYIRRGNGL